MARTTLDESITRRAKVAHLELRGANATGIARELGCDVKTVRRDRPALARDRAQALDVSGTRLRLLESAALIELEGWKLWQTLPAQDINGRLGLMGKILAAQERQSALLREIEAASLVADVEQLKAQMAQLLAERGRPLGKTA